MESREVVIAARRCTASLVALFVFLSACSSTQDPPATEAQLQQHRLVDVAQDVGLDFVHGAFRWGTAADPVAMMGGGLCWIDYNSDGWLDLFVVNSFAEVEVTRWKDHGGLPTNALYENRNGSFHDVSESAGVEMPVRGSGCVTADLDRDGHDDLYVTTSRDNLLLWNNGDGTFAEGADPAGIRAYGWHSGAAVGDVNADGWPDLFVAGYANLNAPNPEAVLGFPESVLGVRDLLFLNGGRSPDGRVTFREIGEDVGLEANTETGGNEYGLGASMADFDRDGDIDIYVANDTNPNRLYLNDPWPGGIESDPLDLGFRLTEVASSAGLADDNAGMGIASGDYDGDAKPDLFVTNLRAQGHALFRSLSTSGSEPSYSDERLVFSELAPHTGWGVSWGDLDLDGDLDLFLVNGDVPLTDLAADASPMQAFQQSSGRFADVSDQLGLDEVGVLHARGSALADYDNDGDLDVAVNQIAGPLVLLENRGAVGNWLQVALAGFHPGSVVTVQLPDGRELVRDVVAGSSYLSSEDPRVHFGLASATRVDHILVTWPGGGVTRVSDVEANQLVTIDPPSGR